MNTSIIKHHISGNTLFADNGIIEIGIPLDFGIRISHLSYLGEENLFFEQPIDMEDLSTQEGWRVRGGHRLWIAPESENNVYYPDNFPVSYEITGDTIKVSQEEDEWLNIKKTVYITFEGESSLKIRHEVLNLSDETKRCALWGVTSVAPCGQEIIPLPLREGGASHLNRFSTWDYTSLGDERVEYKRDKVIINHTCLEQKYKIGIGHPSGAVTYKNKGVVFEKSFDIDINQTYPDGDVSFETFLCKHMVEIEALSPYKEILPGKTAEFEERWRLARE